MTDTRAFGLDTSRYDGLLDWGRFEAHLPAITFIGMRATISWAYRDPFFQANWRGAKAIHTIRSAYHVVYPGEDAERQYDNIMAMVGDDPGELPVTLDIELDHGLPKSTITRTVRRLADIITARTNKAPLLYTRAEWANQFLFSGEFRDLKWWLATYLRAPLFSVYANEHPGPPILPIGIDTYLIHQTGDHMRPICSTTTKAHQDYNRWNGTEADMLQYVYGTANIPEVPEEPPMESSVGIMFEVLRNMNTRSGPSTAFSDVGDLAAGERVRATNVAGGSSWIEIAPGKWAAVEHNGVKYMKRVE